MFPRAPFPNVCESVMKPSSLDLMCEKALRALDPSALEHVKLYNGAIPEYILTMIVNYQHWESFVHAYQYENNREDLLKTAASRDWPPAVRHAVALSPPQCIGCSCSRNGATRVHRKPAAFGGPRRQSGRGCAERGFWSTSRRHEFPSRTGSGAKSLGKIQTPLFRAGDLFAAHAVA